MTSAADRYFRSMTSRDCPITGLAIRPRLIRTHARGWTSLPSGLMGGIVPQLPPLAAEAAPKAMNLIIGILVVFGCVLGGFAVHGGQLGALWQPCLLYTSDAADERSSVDLGGRRIIKKK